MFVSFIALVLFSIGTAQALPSNFTCDTHYPPEYYKLKFPIASGYAGYRWQVECSIWSDPSGDLHFIRDPVPLHAYMLTQFIDGGVRTQFFALNGTHETYTGNITVRAPADEGSITMCVEQTPADFSSQLYMNTLFEVGANMFTDQYINKYDTTAPAYYVSQQEFFVKSQNGKRWFSELTRWNPKTAKTNYKLTCVYNRGIEIPESVGNWWLPPA